MKSVRSKASTNLKYFILILFMAAVVCGISSRVIDLRFQRVPENFNWMQSNVEKFVNDTARQPYTSDSGLDIVRQLLGLGEWSMIALAFLTGFIVHPLLERRKRRTGISTSAAVGIALSSVIVLTFVGINLFLML